MKPKTMYIIVAMAVISGIIIIGTIMRGKLDRPNAKLAKSIEELLISKSLAEEQFNVCQRNLATFKNLDEKNLADIESYILTNYKRVPKIVAKEIAVRTVELTSKYGIAVPILVGMMEVESNFGPHAVSKKYARGLMQVRWKVWGDKLKEELGLTHHHDLHQIDIGIAAGIIVFKYYMETNDNNISRALYNYVGKNEAYVTKVYAAMGKFVLHGVSSIPQTEEYNAK